MKVGLFVCLFACGLFACGLFACGLFACGLFVCLFAWLWFVCLFVSLFVCFFLISVPYLVINKVRYFPVMNRNIYTCDKQDTYL